jgi:hypothetical protein
VLTPEVLGGASGSGGPAGKRNGQYRHGERTKGAIAERQKFSTLLKMLRAGLAVRIAHDITACDFFFAPRCREATAHRFVPTCGERNDCILSRLPVNKSLGPKFAKTRMAQAA